MKEIKKMSIEEAILILEGFEDAIERICSILDNGAFKSEIYMMVDRPLKIILDKWKNRD